MAEERVIQILPQSAQSLYLELLAGDRVLGTATGFATVYAGTTYLLTNRHVVAGSWWTGRVQHFAREDKSVPTAVRIHHVLASDDDREVAWTNRRVDLLSDGRPHWLEHPELGSRMDVVALPLTNLDGIAIDPHDLWDPPPALYYGPSARVSVIGFPFGLRTSGQAAEFPAVWTTGYVASDPMIDTDGLPYFLLDARTREGQSGSPVIVMKIPGNTWSGPDGSTIIYDGLPEVRLVGIYAGRTHRESDIGRVWKADAIKQLVEGGYQPEDGFGGPGPSAVPDRSK